MFYIITGILLAFQHLGADCFPLQWALFSECDALCSVSMMQQRLRYPDFKSCVCINLLKKNHNSCVFVVDRPSIRGKHTVSFF